MIPVVNSSLIVLQLSGDFFILIIYVLTVPNVFHQGCCQNISALSGHLLSSVYQKRPTSLLHSDLRTQSLSLVSMQGINLRLMHRLKDAVVR